MNVGGLWKRYQYLTSEVTYFLVKILFFFFLTNNIGKTTVFQVLDNPTTGLLSCVEIENVFFNKLYLLIHKLDE